MEQRFKQYAAQITEIDEQKMSFVISTAAVDRDNDTIDPKGWDLKHFLKNPVVLWAHDYSQLPVGKAVSIKATDGGLTAEVEFPKKGTYPFADTVHQMLKDGFLNATSVGFKPVEYTESPERKHGYDIRKQELMEFSIVPVPSNPEALALRGLSNEQVKAYGKELKQWMTEHELIEEPQKIVAQVDSETIAKIVAETIKAMTPEPKEIVDVEINPEVLCIDIEEKGIEGVEIDVDIPDDEVSAEDVASELMKQLRQLFKEEIGEMAGAAARSALIKMTGRID